MPIMRGDTIANTFNRPEAIGKYYILFVSEYRDVWILVKT